MFKIERQIKTEDHLEIKNEPPAATIKLDSIPQLQETIQSTADFLGTVKKVQEKQKQQAAFIEEQLEYMEKQITKGIQMIDERCVVLGKSEVKSESNEVPECKMTPDNKRILNGISFLQSQLDSQMKEFYVVLAQIDEVLSNEKLKEIRVRRQKKKAQHCFIKQEAVVEQKFEQLNPPTSIFEIESLVCQLKKNLYLFQTFYGSSVIEVGINQVSQVASFSDIFCKCACLNDDRIILENRVFRFVPYSQNKEIQQMKVTPVVSINGDLSEIVLAGSVEYKIWICKWNLKDGQYDVLKYYRPHSCTRGENNINIIQAFNLQKMEFLIGLCYSFYIMRLDMDDLKLWKVGQGRSFAIGNVLRVEENDNLLYFSSEKKLTICQNDYKATLLMSKEFSKAQKQFVKLPHFNINTFPYILMEEKQGQFFVLDLKTGQTISRVNLGQFGIVPLVHDQYNNLILAIDKLNMNSLCFINILQ